jgi:DNA-binding transcriptional LysR family regulator
MVAGGHETLRGLSSLDLNLLHMLHVVLHERSVVRAAERLCVTPSAVSNALARLRRVLGDPLLERQGRHLVPTPRALRIQPALVACFRGLEAALRAHPELDPSTLERRWTIGASDYAEAVLLPLLLPVLRQRAPRCSIQMTSIDAALENRALQRGDASLLIGRFPVAAEGCRTAELWSDEAVAIARRGHPTIGRRLKFETYAALPHVRTATTDGMMDHVERSLEERGEPTSPVLVAAHFMLVPLVVATSDHIAMFPRRLAERFAPVFGLQVHAPPCALGPLNIQIMWHERSHDDPAEAFLRATIHEVARAELPARDEEPSERRPAASSRARANRTRTARHVDRTH